MEKSSCNAHGMSSLLIIHEGRFENFVLKLEQRNRDLQYRRYIETMVTFFVIVLSIVLILLSLFSVLIILMQRPSEDAGMGSALGGGAVTSIFGGEAGNILHRWTVVSTILFFILSLILSMLYMAREGEKEVIMDVIASPSDMFTPAQDEATVDNGDSENLETKADAEDLGEPVEEI
jgi:protein translocase SecG subunit